MKVLIVSWKYSMWNVVGVRWHMDDGLMSIFGLLRNYPMLGRLQKVMACPHMKWINDKAKALSYVLLKFVSIYISWV